jgi:adenylate kinase family enzyme
VGRKIAVIGNSCSGKTTLGSRLAEQLGVPHVELDTIHHRSNWQEATAEELRRDVAARLDPLDGWVVDGNYMRKIGMLVIDRADTVVWLDLPLVVCVRRMWGRTTSHIRERTELWGTNNRETWRTFIFHPNSLLLYTVRTHRRLRQESAKVAPGRLVQLRSEDEVERWLAAQR